MTTLSCSNVQSARNLNIIGGTSILIWSKKILYSFLFSPSVKRKNCSRNMVMKEEKEKNKEKKPLVCVKMHGRNLIPGPDGSRRRMAFSLHAF